MVFKLCLKIFSMGSIVLPSTKMLVISLSLLSLPKRRKISKRQELSMNSIFVSEFFDVFEINF